MVGLLRTGRMLVTCLILLLGTLSKMYLLFLAFSTALTLKSSFSNICSLLDESRLDFTSTASDLRITCVSLSPFLNKVLPELTMSQIPSASPMLGAISTDPEMVWMSARILFLSKNCWRVTG